MNYKALFHKVIRLLSAPAKAWSEIARQENGPLVNAEYVFPLIGLCGLSMFVGTFFGGEISNDVFQIALTRCCSVCVALFCGFYVTAYILDKFTRRLFGWRGEHDTMNLFTAYSMTVTFVIYFLDGLFYNAVLHWFLLLYTTVLVYEGAKHLVRIKEERLVAYTVMATLVVIACPTIIEFIFYKISSILH